MSQINEEILVANGGLNYDDDPRFFQNGDTDYRLNIIPTSLGDNYVLTNMKGTTKKSHTFTHGSSYSDATYTTIGSCYDVKRHSIYFFIYSDEGNHCILRYAIDDDEFHKIVWDNTKIGLDINYPITDAFMIDDWLYWNPRNSSPRAINVQWAYYDYISDIPRAGTTHEEGDYVRDRKGRVWECKKNGLATTAYPNENPEYFTLIDWVYDDVYPLSDANTGFLYRERRFFNTPTAPIARIQYQFNTDTDYEFNNLRGRVFQFTYRYYVPDMGYTPTAPFTEVIGSFENETYDGEFAGDSTTDNLITLIASVPTLESDDYSDDYIFEHIEFLVREAEVQEWRVIDRIKQSDFSLSLSTYQLQFYNSVGVELVDAASIEKPFNYLPRLANSQASIDGERVAYGRITEGFNVDDIDIDLTGEVSSVPYATSSAGTLQETISFTEEVSYYRDLQEYRYTSDSITRGSYAGQILILTLNSQETRYELTSADVASDSAYLNAFVRLLDYQGVTTDVIGGALRTEYTRSPLTLSVSRYTAATYDGQSSKYHTFKSGAWHPFCIYYADDQMRRSEAIPIDPLYLKSLPESTETTGTSFIYNVDYVINHDPPEYAAHWKFGYAGNSSIEDFWQYNILEADVISDSTSPYDGLSYVDITPLQGLYDNVSDLSINFPNSRLELYSFEFGDRIRFLTQKNISAANGNELTIADEGYDYQISAYDSSTNRLYFNSDGIVGDSDGATEEDWSDPSVIIEIYRPKKEGSSIIYYEIGDWNPIISSGDYIAHGNASGTIHSGDTYLISRVFSKKPTGFSTNTNPVMVESFSWSDFYISELWGKGKPGASYGIGEVTMNNIRYSNKLVKNSLASGVGTFDGLDYKVMSYNFGDITAMRQVGNVLKVIFENNVASVLVNKTQFFNADGTSQIVQSDNILGSINYSEESWGTKNPESVLNIDRNIYFFDLTRKAYVRNAPNGSFPISDYKMRKYFHEKSNDLLDSTVSDVRVYSGWDDKVGLLWVAFGDPNTVTNNEFIAFHEESNRWVTFSDMSYSTTLTSACDYGSETFDLIDLTSSRSDDTQTITLTANDDGTIFGPEDSGSTDQTAVYPGDVVTISAYVSDSTNADLLADTVLYLDFTAGANDIGLSMTNYVGTGNAYSNEITFATYGKVSSYVSIDDEVDVVTGDLVEIVFTISISRNYVPLLQSTPSTLFGFAEEDVYIYNDNDTRCNFYGEQYDYKARVYGGIKHPNVIKTFDSIALHTNKYWDIEDVQIPASLNYPNGMESRVPEARFEKEEGVLRSDYLCNMKTRFAIANTLDLFNGDTLRGYTIYNDLVGDETSEHTLYKVDILQTQSRF